MFNPIRVERLKAEDHPIWSIIVKEFEREHLPMPEEKAFAILLIGSRRIKEPLLIPYALDYVKKMKIKVPKGVIRHQMRYRQIVQLPPFIKAMMITRAYRMELLGKAIFGERLDFT